MSQRVYPDWLSALLNFASLHISASFHLILNDENNNELQMMNGDDKKEDALKFKLKLNLENFHNNEI